MTIEVVTIKPLRRIPDGRGTIMKMLETTDPEFKGFGEVYFSRIYPGVVKGWRLHLDAWLNFSVVQGMIKLVVFDDREGSTSKDEVQEIFLGDDNYCLVQIPPGVWYGFKGVGVTEAIVCDLTTLPHVDDVVRRHDPHDRSFIDYDWNDADR